MFHQLGQVMWSRNCLREVSDKESLSISLDARLLFATQQVGKERVG